MIEDCIFFAEQPTPPQVKDCFPVSVGSGWGSRSSLDTTEYISTDLHSNFWKGKIGDFAIMIEEVGTYSR